MNPIRSLRQLADSLSTGAGCLRVAVVCGCDACTLSAVGRALEAGLGGAVFVGPDAPVCGRDLPASAAGRVEHLPAASPADAARLAVGLVRRGEADILMKGLVGTDVLLRAVLDKTAGLLPAGSVLTHLAVAEPEGYGKLLFFTDVAVIPYPTDAQREAQLAHALRLCRACGVEEPRVALVHCSEKPSDKFPHTLHYRALAAQALEGRWGRAVVDGPLDVRTACDPVALRVKGIASPVGGEADILVFPDIEAGNAFYKTLTFFARAATAGVLCGTTRPVVLPSRGDSAADKFHSLALAALLAARCGAGGAAEAGPNSPS